MKNIIKSAICLIVIAGILLSSTLASAASDTSIFSITAMGGGSNYIYAQLTQTILPSTEDNRSNTTAVYEFTVNPSMNIALVDAYLNGYVRYTVNCSLGSISQGSWYMDRITVSFSYTSSEEYYHVKRNNVNSGWEGLLYFNNYWPIGASSSYVPIGEFTCTVTIHDLIGSYPPATIPIACTGSIVLANYNVSANPVTQGLAGVYKQSILDALEDLDFGLVYDLLHQWQIAQEAYLADIELSVDDLEQILRQMYAELQSIYTIDNTTYFKISAIYDILSTYSSQALGNDMHMISLLSQLLNKNASDTAAESQMQNAEQQLSQAVNDMEVQKPNINNVVNAGDQYMDSNITGAQGDTFFWLHGTNIFVTILTMAVTIGILGFVIYGKSG